jgi:hypothetical protein
VSATQVGLDPETSAALLHDLDLAAIGAPLGGGTFALVHEATTTSGRRVVLKVGPPPEVPLLTYERDLTAAEFDYYIRTAHVLPVPGVLAHTVASGRPAFTMTLEPGRSLVDLDLDAGERAAVRHGLGRHVGALRTVTGSRFGYDRPGGLLAADSWGEAVDLMWSALFADAGRWRVELPTSRIRSLLDRAAPLLATVHTAVLVHFDLWDGNILVTRDTRDAADTHTDTDTTNATGGPRISAIIDGERAFWGDPLAELVSTSLFADPEDDAPFLSGFAETADSPLVFTPDVRARVSLYQAYLTAIMLVERVPRARADDSEEESYLRGMLSAQLDRADRALADLGR